MVSPLPIDTSAVAPLWLMFLADGLTPIDISENPLGAFVIFTSELYGNPPGKTEHDPAGTRIVLVGPDGTADLTENVKRVPAGAEPLTLQIFSAPPRTESLVKLNCVSPSAEPPRRTRLDLARSDSGAARASGYRGLPG